MANQDMRQAVLAALNCDDILLACYGNEELYEADPGWFPSSDSQWGTDAGKEYYNQNGPDKEFRPYRKEIQMVFQNTLSALNPRQRIGTILEDILKVHEKTVLKNIRNRFWKF